MLVQVTRDVRDFGVELVPGEGLTYHTRENLDTYFWYAWDTSHASDAKKPCFSYPTSICILIPQNMKGQKNIAKRKDLILASCYCPLKIAFEILKLLKLWTISEIGKGMYHFPVTL